MVQVFKFAHWVALTFIPAFMWYLTGARGDAARLDNAVESFAPTIAALLPFAAIVGLVGCLVVLSLNVTPWLFELLPQSFGLRFAFYRNRKVKELYPALQQAIEFDVELNYARSGQRDVQNHNAQMAFIVTKLGDLGIVIEVPKHRSHAQELVRDLVPFAKDGSFENVRRICEPYR